MAFAVMTKNNKKRHFFPGRIKVLTKTLIFSTNIKSSLLAKTAARKVSGGTM